MSKSIPLTFSNTLRIAILTLFTTSYSASSIKAQTVTWAENIAPILYNNCTQCHIDGGIAPFSLVGYNKAKAYASSIAAAAQNRTMPPWPADPKYRRYAHERILSTEEIEQISHWAKNNTPEGDISKAPKEPKPNTGTTITQPTLRLKMPNYTVNTNSDEYRCFVLPTGFTTDQFLTAIEVVPGNPKVVHHVLVFHDTSSYVPGQEPYQFPDGLGAKLMKGGSIILQVHYPSYVQNELDSTKVLLKTTTQTLRNMIIAPAVNHTQSLQNGPLYIPADQTKTFISKFPLNNTVTVFAVAPHMHLVGKTIKAFNVNGKDTTPIVSIPNWDFHWQRTYIMRQPLIFLKGSTIWGEGLYDNTAQNPNNPNSPPVAVSAGEGTKDEMMLVYFWIAGFVPGDEFKIVDFTPLKNISKVKVSQKTWVKIYPNPTQGDRVWLESQNPCVAFTLHDAAGRAIKSGLPLYDNQLSGSLINVEGIPTGCYQLRLQFANGQHQTQTLIKQ
ncbi:MAG: T9SS type A sorting domain-containing protein [Bacteroidetes bacterium]|nr:T9SS type A sorting domain-containing protein [Bacteroidota bacterium]